MHDAILVSPAELAALRARLAAFGQKDRSRGSSYFRSGAVREAIRPLDDEFHDAGSIGFEADVMGSQLYTVEWLFTPRAGWGCSCSCPVEIDCKHAHAAAEQFLVRRVGGPDRVGQGTFFASAPLPPPAPSEAARLVALLEQRHGRTLTKAEIAFVNKLERLWQRHQRDGTIYPQELADVSLADRGAGLYYDPNPAIRGWWSEPLGSPLELWQYLAHFAERANRPLPPLMKPLTDTALVRARIEAQERKRRVEHWKQIFHEPAQPDAGGTIVTVPEVRLRLADPKLIWEYRSASDAPWRSAKGGVVKQWFEVASSQPAGVPATTLALLQEVQLRRLQSRQGFGYYSSTEPQTLKLEDETTKAIIHWLVSHPGLRHMFVNNDGVPYEMAPETLTWVARPASDDAHDVEVFLAMPDGAPLPRGLVELEGQPSLGLYGNFIFTLPQRLPGIDAGRTVRIPREALEIPEAVRHLGRARVRPMGGLALPELHRLVLAPRFLCGVHEQLAGRELLRVELHARSAEGSLVRVRQGIHG